MKPTEAETKKVTLGGMLKLWPLMQSESRALLLALLAVTVNSGLTVLAPYLIAQAIDVHIAAGDYGSVLRSAAILMGLYLLTALANYQQVKLMGGVGQRVLYRLRERVFVHLQTLPLRFFQAHKSGDLISRINNDTQKLNQFFSETLVRLFGSLFVMSGAALFMLILQPKLGLMAMGPVLFILLITQIFTPWVRKANTAEQAQLGLLSAHIQESLEHFKVVVAFNRRDFFKTRFAEVNQASFKAAQRAGIANQLFSPLYDFFFQLARLLVLGYGILLISQGQLSVGLLIAYFTYLSRFYEPLRQIATLWTSFQMALAAWDRVEAILAAQNDLPQLEAQPSQPQAPRMCFEHVDFCYQADLPAVLQDVCFELEAGKTYAFVGPTGGGKSTTASLMTRLYDPSAGQIHFEGRDLRSLSPAERSEAIGFILQEPFLFSASLAQNLSYGNARYHDCQPETLLQALQNKGLDVLLQRFDKGLDTPILAEQDNLSLGQKQLIAFMRAVLREPRLLILDEATANIDTVTEQLLEDILAQLPTDTTRVIIAHRLNTIANADQIFFVNAGKIIPAGRLEDALKLLETEVSLS